MDAVRAAARVCRQVRRTLVKSDTLDKRDHSPVTIADFASQAIICAMLTTQFPDDVVVGEEQTDQLRQADHHDVRATVVEQVAQTLGDRRADERQVLDWIDHAGQSDARGSRYWTVDPIDGTKGFLRGGQYAVALALLEEGQVVLGVLGCPNLNHQRDKGLMVAAVKGFGSRLMSLDSEETAGQAVRVSEISDSAQARFCESVESAHSSHDDAARIAQTLGIHTDPLRMDSQVKYAAVSRGDAHIYLRLPTGADYRENIWDHAAGMLVVAEAGGQVSDIHGQPLDFSQGLRLEKNTGIVATNGRLHESVIEAIATAGI